MTNNFNMSDYQKIIFANNINETNFDDLIVNGQNINSIQQLSKAYPFVVFFTNCNNDDNTYKNVLPDEGVRNIWIDGIRATKFVGTDPNSSVAIGDHIIKLQFDYNTGLLSIVDANKLESIKLIACTYKGYDNATVTLNDMVSTTPQLVAPKDNVFDLIFRFKVRDGGDINIISKALNISCMDTNANDYFEVIEAPIIKEFTGYTNTSSEACVFYKCKIKYNTETLDNNFKNYNAISQYDNTINDQFRLSLRLSPERYIVLFNNNEKVNDKSVKVLQANTENNFSIRIYPPSESLNESNAHIGVPFYPFTKSNFVTINLNVISDNRNCAAIIDDNNNKVTEITKKVEYYDVPFKIWTENENGGKITIRLETIDNITGLRYTIEKSFTINVNNSQVQFYCGYNFDRGNMIPINISNYNIVYDWKDNDWNITDNQNEYFYIAFTSGYEDKIVSCWDCYVEENNNKKYLPIGNEIDNNNNGRFVKVSNSPLGISLYKSSVPGKFFGKIQIQNA